MRFSEEFGVVSSTEDDDWFDLEVSSDTPLYIDPMLVFKDEDPLWAATQHDAVVFCNLAIHYLARSAAKNSSALWCSAFRVHRAWTAVNKQCMRRFAGQQPRRSERNKAGASGNIER